VDLLQYYLYFLFIFLLYGVMNSTTLPKLNKGGATTVNRTYLFWVLFALWILIGMRDIAYGQDTLSYVLSFRKSVDYSTVRQSVEPLFSLLTSTVRSVTDNYHVYLMVGALSTPIALYYLFKSYFNSTFEVLTAICIYTLLGLLAFNMAAMRQTIALSWVIVAFVCADRGKWLKFLVCVAVAYLFHNSSFVAVALYPLRYLNLSKWGFLGVAVAVAIGTFMPDAVIPFVQSHIFDEDRFVAYGTVYESSQNYTAFFLQLILVVVAYLRQNCLQVSQTTKNLLFNVAYIGLSIQALAGVLAEFYRLSFYFCTFDIVLVSLALSTYKGEVGRVVKVGFIVGCLFYIFVLSGGGVLPTRRNLTIWMQS
jgi:hypothetical protein